MLSVDWSVGAEAQRDSIRAELIPHQRERFDKALREILEQIEVFPESAPAARRARGREDIRQAVFGDGYCMLYIIFPERVAVLSIIPPGSSQALD